MQRRWSWPWRSSPAWSRALPTRAKGLASPVTLSMTRTRTVPVQICVATRSITVSSPPRTVAEASAR